LPYPTKIIRKNEYELNQSLPTKIEVRSADVWGLVVGSSPILERQTIVNFIAYAADERLPTGGKMPLDLF
jgi:hypothetical protein